MEQWERKKRFLMVVPVLVLPFVAFLFWSLGGGKGKAAPVTNAQGINASLPSAQLLKDAPADKMSLYQQADKDSQVLAEQMRNDPFRQDSKHHPAEISPFFDQPAASTASSGSDDANERKVRQKLAELEQQLRAEPPKATEAQRSPTETMYQQKDEDIAKLEAMMQSLSGNAAATGGDPELSQLNGMLEKVLDIQHPDRVREKLKANSAKDKDKVFPVLNQDNRQLDDLLAEDTTRKKLLSRISATRTTVSDFYGLEETAPDFSNNGITAVIHKNQTLVSGANVKLRTTQDLFLQGKLIPTGTFVSGIASLNGERLQIHIEHIRYQDAVFPVDLTVFSLDGIEGIHIPGAISRDAAKQGADEALQTLQMSSLDPSITAQAASAGIETVKSFLSKKTKLVRVTVKADHPVLLMNSNNN
ncbi:conjugative transposon protein TraM [Chitinophaga sp. Ak27]|uniref:conjugative transposon protein TraM n=1 Tax=Chitinophaga sp. Ak27 TaxID=2726116 RepID=UPI00145DF6B4|nr:conjugative transposon protein TraM [Chitinophaga sp. Ak27]NLU91376.1 conjugative transposon protein TraM [Chitinophaga sp. Ak27]